MVDYSTTQAISSPLSSLTTTTDDTESITLSTATTLPLILETKDEQQLVRERQKTNFQTPQVLLVASHQRLQNRAEETILETRVDIVSTNSPTRINTIKPGRTLSAGTNSTTPPQPSTSAAVEGSEAATAPAAVVVTERSEKLISSEHILKCEPDSTRAYQLRALKGKQPAIEDNHQHHSGIWSESFNVSSLSAGLIDETLNYFVNCRHRLSQITKTFDDSDAYILLLQEKEMDLELVARIGQDLLKQFNEVKDSNRSLREELARSHEENQQLRHELASKNSLLDTFLEEEEHQHQQHQDTSIGVRSSNNNHSDVQYDDEPQLDSLSRIVSPNESNLYKRLIELQDEIMMKDEALFKQNLVQQEKNFHLEVQLRDSERRLADLETENEILRSNQRELYEEIKNHTKNFSELLRIFAESQRESRAHDINNISFDSFESQLDSTLFLDQHPHYDTHQPTPPASSATTPSTYIQQNQQIVRPLVRNTSGNNIPTSTSLHEELLESMHKSGEISECDDDDDDDDNHDIVKDIHQSSADSSQLKTSDFYGTPTRQKQYNSPRHFNTTLTNTNNSTRSERRQQNHRSINRQQQHNLDSDGCASDGADSGLHTSNISTSTTPINIGLNLDTDSDDATSSDGSRGSGGGRGASSAIAALVRAVISSRENEDDSRDKKNNWLGLSTFTISTLLLLCLSASFNSTGNSNFAQRLQQLTKIDR